MKDGLGTTQGWMPQRIAYNILLALGPLLIFLSASCGLMPQQMNAESANPVKPVTDWTNINLIRA